MATDHRVVAPALVVRVSGVCGVATFDGTGVSERDLGPMERAAPYRGEDGSGSWLSAGIGLTQQRRCSIPNEAREPLVDGDLVIVGDMRLDNRNELLTALGLSDRRCGDLTLVVAAYRAWGSACAVRLLGDFAFAIWDDRARKLFAARDPLGMRSLAYHSVPRRAIVVATEVKQVLAGPGVPSRVHEASVAADLIGHYGRPEWTAYENVERLSPGHVLEADSTGTRTWRFWAPDPAHRVLHPRRGDYADHLRELFIEAVTARLRTDHPVGILLSGGIDSGSVAAAAGALMERGTVAADRLHAATWSFDELRECDERAVARQVVTRYGIGWSEIPGDHRGPLAGYPDHGPPRDEPFVGAFQPLIDDSLAAARGAGCRVVLGGDRGDLVIGWTGYRHFELLRRRQLAHLFTEVGEHHGATGDPFSQIIATHLMAPGARRVRRKAGSTWNRVKGQRPGSPEPVVPPWVDDGFAKRIGLADIAATHDRVPEGFGPARSLRYEWIFMQLHMRGMAWSERSYAVHGLSFADPFSDRRLVEFALAVPQAAIAAPGDNSKPLMRAAIRGIMPDTALREAGKVVPQPLFDRALSTDSATTLRGLVSTMATSERGWVKADVLRDHYEAWLRGGRLRPEFWGTLVTEWWLRERTEGRHL